MRAPCQATCPSAIPTQDRINLLRQGKVKEALELVLKYSPFPGSVCGEVCPNLCMDACTRQFLDHPVAMKELGRLSLEAAAPTARPASGKKVAVIGGGPGGLSAAWQLRLLGHEVTVYEADGRSAASCARSSPTERLPASRCSRPRSPGSRRLGRRDPDRRQGRRRPLRADPRGERRRGHRHAAPTIRW